MVSRRREKDPNKRPRGANTGCNGFGRTMNDPQQFLSDLPEQTILISFVN